MVRQFILHYEEINYRSTAWGWGFVGFLLLCRYAGRVKFSNPKLRRINPMFRFFKVTGPILVRFAAPMLPLHVTLGRC